MKKLVFIILLSCIMCACNSGSSQGNNSSKTANVSVDSSDSVEKSIKTCQIQIDKNNEKIESVSKDLEDKASKQIVYLMISCIIIIFILVILILINISRLINEKEIERYIRPIVESCLKKQEKLSVNNISDSINVPSKDYLNEISCLKKQLDNLEKEIEEIEKKIGKLSSKPIECNIPEISSIAKKQIVSYLGVNNEKGIIGKCYTSLTEEAVFKCFSSSDTEIKFEPVLLERIKAISTIQSALKIKGSLQDAKSMIVIKQGKARLMQVGGQKYWKIEELAEVELK